MIELFTIYSILSVLENVQADRCSITSILEMVQAQGIPQSEIAFSPCSPLIGVEVVEGSFILVF